MNTEWKTVPATMTLDMCVAFAEAWFSKVRCIDDPEMQDAYAAMLAAAPPAPTSHPIPTGATGEDSWRIDNSAGRPILVRNNCSVIEAEDAEYVLRLIAADRARAPTFATSIFGERIGKMMDGSAAPAAGDALDKSRLDWLEQHDGRFYNKDRISSIVGTGFLVAGDERGVRHQSVRAAIDAAIAALAAQVPQQGEA